MIKRKRNTLFLMMASCLVAFFPLLLSMAGLVAIFDGLSDVENRDLFLGGLLNACALAAMLGGCLSYAISRSYCLYAIGGVLYFVSAGDAFVYTGQIQVLDVLAGTFILLVIASSVWPKATKKHGVTSAQAG